MMRPGVPAVAAVLVCAVLAAGCGESGDVFDVVPAGSDSAGVEMCVGGADAQTIDITYGRVDYLWRRDLGGDMLTNPIASDGTLYVATSGIESTGNGDVFALDAATGEELWRFRMLNSYGYREDAAAVVLFEGDLYVVSQDDDIYALDSATGELRWRSPYLGRGSQPSVSRGFVYTKPSTGGPVQALDTETGDVVWEYSEESFFGYWGLAVSDGAVYGTTWSDIRALEGDTGQLRWVFKASAGEFGLHTAGGLVYGRDQRTLYAIDAATGNLMWKRDVGAQSIVLRNDTVYVGSGESPLPARDDPEPVRALAADTGEDRWRSDTCGRPFSGPNSVLYVVNGWLLSALNEHTGERLWSYDLSPPQTPTRPEDDTQTTLSELELLTVGSHQAAWLTSPVWKGDTVHIGSADGRVFALNALTGDLRWQSDTNTPIATEYFLMTSGAYIHRGSAVDDEVVYVTNGGLIAYSAHSS